MVPVFWGWDYMDVTFRAGVGDGIDIPFVAENSTDTYSLYFD